MANSRKWLITINNPLEHGFDHARIKAAVLDLPSVVYWCMCDEQGDECATLHTHVYFVLKNTIPHERVDARFPSFHRDIARGKSSENRAYVLKDGEKFNKQPDGSYSYKDTGGHLHEGINFSDTFEEGGEMPAEQQGKSRDADKIVELIKSGATNEEIVDAVSSAYRDIEKVERVRSMYRDAQFKDSWRDLEVTYIFGKTGSGKTRFYVKPNLMQCFPTSDYPTSFVVTDPKGTLVLETGQMFQRAGYRVKILNTINFSKSMKYNPFVYIHSEKDVLKLVNTLIANTKGEGEKSAEDFWVKSERLFYTALIGYIWYEAPAEEMNFTTLLEMINASEAREDDPEFQSPVDLMFERLEQKDPDHFAVRQYKKFLLSAGKTRSSILISCGARLAPFDIREVRELMEDDEMELDTIGDEKTVLFLIMSDTDTTFNFILAMLQSQLINLLCDRADDKYGGRLPVHVRLILDEFANIGQIPNFDKLIATIRSREISASIILQSQSQLKAIYKDAAEIISDNCDSVLFLSGRGKNAKEISDALGKETIDSFNTSENRGSQTSHGLNYQKLGKALMSEDEIAIMDGGKCILQLRGVRPFFSEKFDITKHPHYKYLADADKKNTFDVDRFLSTLRRKRQQVVAQDESFDLYEIDLSDEDAAAE